MFRTITAMSSISLAMWSAPAAAEWVRVTSSTEGAAYFMDASRITSEGGRIHAWVKVDQSGNRAVAYRSEMELFSFICSSQKVRLLSYTEYDSYGKVVRSGSNPDMAFGEVGYDVVTPETVGETIMKIACAKS